MWYPIRLVSLLALLGLLSSTAFAATATIERMSGSPKIFEIGEAGARQVSLPRQGGEYTLPIEVETGADDSAVFRLPDSEVSVAPDSIMRIDAPEPRGTGLFQRILQKAGTSFFSVDRRSVEHFEVRTPYLVSVVKGTIFSVVVRDDGATVALHEGRLLVTSPDGLGSVDLLPGDIAFSTSTGEVRKLSRSMARQPAATSVPDNNLQSVPRQDGAAAGAVATSIVQSEAGTAGLPDLPRDGVVAAAAGTPADVLTTAGLTGASAAPDLNPGIAGGLAGSVVDDAGSLTSAVLSPVAGGAAELVSDTGAAAGGLVEDLGTAAGGLVNDVGATAGDLVGGVTTTTSDLVSAATAPAGDLVSSATAPVGSLVGDLGPVTADTVIDTGTTVADITGSVTDGTGDLVADLGTSTGDLLVDTADAVDTGTVTETLDDLTGGLEGLGPSLPRLLP